MHPRASALRQQLIERIDDLVRILGTHVTHHDAVSLADDIRQRDEFAPQGVTAGHVFKTRAHAEGAGVEPFSQDRLHRAHLRGRWFDRHIDACLSPERPVTDEGRDVRLKTSVADFAHEPLRQRRPARRSAFAALTFVAGRSAVLTQHDRSNALQREVLERCVLERIAVRMCIDETRRNDLAAGVDDALRLDARSSADANDLISADQHVGLDRRAAVADVDEAALDPQIVWLETSAVDRSRSPSEARPAIPRKFASFDTLPIRFAPSRCQMSSVERKECARSHARLGSRIEPKFHCVLPRSSSYSRKRERTPASVTFSGGRNLSQRRKVRQVMNRSEQNSRKKRRFLHGNPPLAFLASWREECFLEASLARHKVEPERLSDESQVTSH